MANKLPLTILVIILINIIKTTIPVAILAFNFSLLSIVLLKFKPLYTKGNVANKINGVPI